MWDPALSSIQRNQAVTQGLVWRLSWHRHSPSTMYPCTPFPRRAQPHGRSREKPSFAGIYTHRLVTTCKGKGSGTVAVLEMYMHNASYCPTAYNSQFIHRNQTSPHSKDIFRVRLLEFLTHELLSLKQPSKYPFP